MTWDEYFIAMTRLVATKSKDRSTKTGCVIVGQDNEIVSTGFNGFPRGIDDNVEKRHDRPIKYQYTEHAERNAIYNAARIGVSLKNTKMYIETSPCHDCVRGIIQAGIGEIIVDSNGSLSQRQDWNESFKIGQEMLQEAGIKVRFL